MKKLQITPGITGYVVNPDTQFGLELDYTEAGAQTLRDVLIKGIRSNTSSEALCQAIAEHGYGFTLLHSADTPHQSELFWYVEKEQARKIPDYKIWTLGSPVAENGMTIFYDRRKNQTQKNPQIILMKGAKWFPALAKQIASFSATDLSDEYEQRTYQWISSVLEEATKTDVFYGDIYDKEVLEGLYEIANSNPQIAALIRKVDEETASEMVTHELEPEEVVFVSDLIVYSAWTKNTKRSPLVRASTFQGRDYGRKRVPFFI
jgi:hypothetical protein